MIPEPDIRVLQPGEEDTLRALYDECFEEPFGADAFRSLLASPGMWATIAQNRDGEAAGFAVARCVADEAEIISIGVRPADWRCGIGAALLADVMVRSIKLGVRTIFLEVSEQNSPAQALYAGAGFLQVGRREDYYKDKTNGGVAALIMRYAVKKSVS
jgi:ribosomal-protein-alanine N-acetyltransferase